MTCNLPQSGLLYPRPYAIQQDVFPDRREHRPLVNELLDPVQYPLTALSLPLGGLLTEERVDVCMASVRVRAA